MALNRCEISDLNRLFAPRSIVVVGASRDARSMSGQLAANLAGSYRGPLFLVNPHATLIAGRPAYHALADVPDPIDLVFVAVRADQVLAVAEQCARRRAAVLVVISAGFSETGAEGAERERQLVALAAAHNMALVGPNCFGICNTDLQNGFNGTFSPLPPVAGTVAVGTQSGAIGAIIPDYARHWNFGLSSFVSMGNKAGVAEHQLVEWWGQDPHSKVILLYLESLSDPRALLSCARAVTKRKPIVVLHAGTTAAGARAAASHTAALAGSTTATEALLRQAGMVVVDDLEDLLATTSLLVSQPSPRGNRVAVLTNAGGPAVMCVDELLRAGLEVPELSASLQRQLATLLPDAAARRNPVDLIGSIDAAQYRACLECLLASEEVDAVVAVYVPRILDSGSDVAQSILEACGAAADAGRAKPVVPVIMQSEFSTTWRQSGRQFNSFEFPHIAARALARSVHYAQWKADADLNTAEPLGASAVALQRQFRQATDEAGWLAADEVFGLLKSAGFSVPVWHIATSQAAAVQAAKSLDGPVVLKAVAPELLHKARAGGVQLDLEGAAVVAAAYERLVKRIPHCQAVIVQPFLSGGCELLMGVAWEERFGHLIAFGAGGSQVEAQADVAFRLHPLTRRDAEDLVAETRIGREQLQRLPAAREAVMHLLECLSSLITQLPQIRELDFNPVKVWPDGRICIVDARIRREIALPANENRLLG